jgi:hypothetical protein
VPRSPFIEPSHPELSSEPPTGRQWLHEVKHCCSSSHADRFYDGVPIDVRHRGAWRSSRGLVVNLRRKIRLALTRDGYSLIETPEAIFNPEVSST